MFSKTTVLLGFSPDFPLQKRDHPEKGAADIIRLPLPMQPPFLTFSPAFPLRISNRAIRSAPAKSGVATSPASF